MKVFRIGVFYTEMLNLNGDGANALVLASRLRWYGIESEIVDLSATSIEAELEAGLDFALLGHGSEAAWAFIRNIEPKLGSVAKAIKAKVPLLAVSSGFEELGASELLPVSARTVSRVSKFVVTSWNDLELLGYVNSDADLPVFERYENVFATLLHGPILAKNPDLADWLISHSLGKQAPLAAQKLEKLALVAEILEDVRNLEVELANQ